MSKPDHPRSKVSRPKRGTGPDPASFEEELEDGYERGFGAEFRSDEPDPDEAGFGEADAERPDGSFDPGQGVSTPPQSVDEALARALRHGRSAAAEVLAALRALLDAVALATRGSATDDDPLLGPLAELLEGLEARLATNRDAPPALIGALADALDAEIARWEERARNDAEARAVLRAFLGVRELLWEFGLRSTDSKSGDAGERKGPKRSRPAGRKRPAAKKKKNRVQRVRVEG